MSLTTFFSHVLDDPLYVGNDTYISVVTSGKVNIVGQERDINKDAAAKAGLIKVNTKDHSTKFIDFDVLGTKGDRYRGAVVIDNVVYIMRTQQQYTDNIVRIAAVNLSTDTVEMIEEKAISVNPGATPKVFCGHFNFGRPRQIGTKIVYPPLKSGIVIVFDTVTREFFAHDIPNEFASIWSTYLPETNEVVFFPYGGLANSLLILNLTTNTHELRHVDAPGAFYCAFTHNGKAIGVPHIMGPKSESNFWMYDGKDVTVIKYEPSSGIPTSGFKYGSVDNDIFYTHTCKDQHDELIEFNLKDNTIKCIQTDLPLGAKPITVNGNTYLFPSIANTSQLDAPGAVYKLVNGQVVKDFDLPTNNISYGPINDNQGSVLFVPYKFELNNGKLDSVLTIVDLENSTAKSLEISLELE